MPELDDLDLQAKVVEVLDRWPSAGLAVGVVRGGSLEWFLGHGMADLESKEPITQDTVFRIGSITKTFTAIAVLQLWEQGLVDLDAPANDYLRAFRLIPAKASFRPPTVRHLLTHTAGVGYWRRLSDLLQPGVGSGIRAGRSGAPPLADYYRRGLPVEIQPGTRWVYSNHGFAALGQLVEDVSGQPLDHYLREHIFAPLGMEHTDLVRSERVRPRLATGYVLRSRGLKPVADREVPTPGGSGMYASTADLGRYLAALLGGGTGEHGSVLKPDTLASMFQPHFQPDPRVPGMGLGFEPGEESGHATVGKTGVLAGFLSAMVLAPDDGIGVVVCSNTGWLPGRGVAEPLAVALLRRLLGLPDTVIRADIPVRPESWSEVCGWYSPDAGPATNLFLRASMGAGAEVTVHDGQLLLKPLTPIPAMRRGLRLYPDDPDDRWVFRAEFPNSGKSSRVVFSRGPEDGGAPMRLLVDVMSLQKRPEVRNPRRWVNGGLAAGAAALAIRRGLHMLQPDQVTDSLHAYQLAKRGNSLRVMAEAVRWGRRGARVNTISPRHHLHPAGQGRADRPRGAGYRRMLDPLSRSSPLPRLRWIIWPGADVVEGNTQFSASASFFRNRRMTAEVAVNLTPTGAGRCRWGGRCPRAPATHPRTWCVSRPR